MTDVADSEEMSKDEEECANCGETFDVSEGELTDASGQEEWLCYECAEKYSEEEDEDDDD